MKKLLVVDDSVAIRDMVKKSFRDQGFEVLAAASVREGLETLRQHAHVDLILSDLIMPEQDGFDFLGELRAMPSFAATPFLFLTTVDCVVEKQRARHMNAHGWIQKPFNPDELVSLAKRMTDAA